MGTKIEKEKEEANCKQALRDTIKREEELAGFFLELWNETRNILFLKYAEWHKEFACKLEELL
jgi:hypothetical protein